MEMFIDKGKSIEDILFNLSLSLSLSLSSALTKLW